MTVDSGRPAQVAAAVTIDEGVQPAPVGVGTVVGDAVRDAVGRVRPLLWLVAWWAIGRAVVILSALALRPSWWALDTWDGRWYRMVARDGYLLVPGRQSDPAFFPLYPALLRTVHALGLSYMVAGPLLSNLALLAALAVFYVLTRDLFGGDTARRATTYVAVFPLGYVFSMTYPESIVLALLAGAVVAATRGRWWIAAACGAAAALARPEGLFIALPLAAIAWGNWRSLGHATRGAALGAVLAPAAALASYPLYLTTVLHDPLAWQKAQLGWNRQFSPVGFVSAFAQLPSTLAHDPWRTRDVVSLFLYLALLEVARRMGAPRSWLLAGLAVVVLPAFSGTFDSIGRFGLLVPPLFWGLASLGRRPRVHRAILACSLALLAGATLTILYVFP